MLPSKILEQTAFITRPKIEEHMLIVLNKPTQKEHFYQPIQTNNKQFIIATTFLTGYNGIFNVTNSDNKFHFKKSVTDEDGYMQITIKPGAYEIENLNNEKKRIIIDEKHYTELDNPFKIKPIFSSLGSFIKISTQAPGITVAPDDKIGDILRFNKTAMYEEYTLSPNPVGILLFENMFLEGNIAQV